VESLTSDELADRIGLSRGTIVHHLHKLEEAGLVLRDKNKYALRDGNLSEVLDELEKDLHRTIAELKQVAQEIDTELGLERKNRDKRTIL